MQASKRLHCTTTIRIRHRQQHDDQRVYRRRRDACRPCSRWVECGNKERSPLTRDTSRTVCLLKTKRPQFSARFVYPDWHAMIKQEGKKYKSNELMQMWHRVALRTRRDVMSACNEKRLRYADGQLNSAILEGQLIALSKENLKHWHSVQELGPRSSWLRCAPRDGL